MDELQIAAGAVILAVMALCSRIFWMRRNISAHLSPVRREMKKEKAWLRRGEYNAAMVKGRQNLELLLKLVAEFHGIQLDNTAQAMANAKAGPARGAFSARKHQGRRVKKVMTHQQFGWWLDSNGYLDRVGKWELNEIRLIGNKAVHENYASKEDAWNQYNYLEDVFKLISEKSAGRDRGGKPGGREQPENRQPAGKKTAGSKKKGKKILGGKIPERKNRNRRTQGRKTREKRIQGKKTLEEKNRQKRNPEVRSRRGPKNRGRNRKRRQNRKSRSL